MSSARRSFERILNTVHALFLCFPVALFSAALVTDIAYLNTAQIQWTNFSSWLIAGALVFGGAVIASALLVLVLDRRNSLVLKLVYLAVVVAMWAIGLINAFQHSRDAWSSVGTAGLAMSMVCTLLALTAGLLLFSRPGLREIDR